MEEKAKITEFRIDKDKCIGCELCIDVCPMKILEIQDEICVLEDAAKCIECGNCLRECQEGAICIEGFSNADIANHQPAKSPKRQKSDIALDTKLTFTPILDMMMTLLKEIGPVQSYDCLGDDVTDLDDFELEGEPCFFRVYAAEKLEKIGVSSVIFFGAMNAAVVCITPGDEYDFPMFVMDWDESEDHIFFICDLVPTDDVGRNTDYLNKYLYEPLEDLFQEHATIPGLKPSVFHWVRATQSPYCITGTIDKSSKESVTRALKSTLDYLKVWIEIYKKATPMDPESDYMKLVNERKVNIRKTYHFFDPGGGAIEKFLGEKRARKALNVIMP